MHAGIKLIAMVTPCDRHSEIWGHVLAYVIGNMQPFPLVHMQLQCGQKPPLTNPGYAPAGCLPEWSSDNVVSDVHNSLHILIIEHVYCDPECEIIVTMYFTQILCAYMYIVCITLYLQPHFMIVCV